MRTISPALLAHLQGSVQTVCTLWLITRKDGQTFGFTDLDRPITYNGMTYQTAGGYTHSLVDMTSDLSTANLEITAVFDSSTITQASLESGQWDFAKVVSMLVNYNDLTQGAVILESGYLGQVKIANGIYTGEVRGFAQLVQQDQGDVYSPTCRATFGDSKCTVNTAPLTANGTVASVNGPTSWNDPTLTQVGPTALFIDTIGHKVPTQSPFQIQAVAPAGGSYVSDAGVTDRYHNSMQPVSGGTSQGQYNASPTGLYTFDVTSAGVEVFISLNYAIGFFTYGTVKWLTGQNAGFSMEVKAFAPGVVTLAMAMPYPIAPGDTYTITAGCDKQIGTCSGRYSNVVHFRGEPYIPGPDVLLSPRGQ